MRAPVVAAAVVAALASCCPATWCPEGANLMPCRCHEYAIGLRVTCTGIRNPRQLVGPFTYLRDYELNSLTLQDVNFSITVHLFEGLRVTTIRIVSSTFHIEDAPFHGRADTALVLGTRINFLDVRHTDLDFGNAHLAAMNSLEHVMVDTSTIQVLRKNWFHGLTQLKSFAIENTRIDRVEEQALSGLDSVEEIKLPANKLYRVQRNYFPHLAASLRFLDFSDNKLTSLPHDMFENMPVLESVMLSRNKFKTLSPAPWRPMLRQLHSIKLDGNPIDCGANISWLLEGDARHKISGTCTTPRLLAGVSISELNDTRYSR
ncbi:uncharacterized protein LOC144104148 isoform X4 [Amblyomma americanum]